MKNEVEQKTWLGKQKEYTFNDEGTQMKRMSPTKKSGPFIREKPRETGNAFNAKKS
jgi:hypothetical protein